MARPSAYSWFGPPEPLPRTVTVNSPPDMIATFSPLAFCLERHFRVFARDIAGLAFEIVAEHDDAVAEIARDAALPLR